MKGLVLSISLSSLSLVGCVGVGGKSTVMPTAPVVPATSGAPAALLSWETPDHPERTGWSRATFDAVTELFDVFDSAQDAERFCPRYKSLSKEEKVLVWSEMFSAISQFESGWEPACRTLERTMGTDPVTGRAVYSEGLLQLSYQDVTWAKYCRFDWNADKLLEPDDPNKTILQPLTNLDCGIRIMAGQIGRHGKVIVGRGAYWATIKEDRKSNRIDQIIAMTKSLGFCQ